MKNLKTILGVGMLAIAVSADATPNTVTLTQNSYSFDVGGEFNATTSQNFLPNYSPLAIVGAGFETFCIETTVDFYPGATYTYTLGSVDSRGTNLTAGAAYLYEQFAKGTLANYDYADTATRNADAGALEAAIWWFQGEQTYGGYPDPTSTLYYQQALTYLGGLGNADAPNDGRFPVDVLQMWNGTTPAQNQLVLVPDNSATAGLFGLGLTGLGVLRRRFKVA